MNAPVISDAALKSIKQQIFERDAARVDACVDAALRHERVGRAVAALGFRHDAMRGVWNNASDKDRRFICKIINIVGESIQHDSGDYVGVGAWAKSWDELSEHSRVQIAECFMKLKGWVLKLDGVREVGVHHG